jgi:hypothetical protein
MLVYQRVCSAWQLLLKHIDECVGLKIHPQNPLV